MDKQNISARVREQAPIILAAIKQAKSVLLHCHPNPDADSVGSALAMKQVLDGWGIKATVMRGDSEIPANLRHLPGAEQVLNQNYFEIDLQAYDLFIILDSSVPHMISQLEKVVFPPSMKTVNIDHHKSNSAYADINLVDESPASAFVVYQLIKEWGVEITHDIAINLFLGIYTDTGGFSFPGTNHRIFEAVAELTKIAPDYLDYLFTLYNSNSKDAVLFDALALNSIETFCDNQVVVATVANRDIESNNLTVIGVSGGEVLRLLRSVIGWDIVVLITELKPRMIRINFRTRNDAKYDLTKVAVVLGGGGHRGAAGVLLTNISIEEARHTVVAKVKELYNL